jgi:hypothetical protein
MVYFKGNFSELLTDGYFGYPKISKMAATIGKTIQQQTQKQMQGDKKIKAIHT